MGSLTNKVVKGVLWNGFGNIVAQVLQFATSIILMRLLHPSDYGLLSMAMICTGFAGIFNEFGLGTAIVQRNKISERELSSIFWMNLINGFLFTLLLYLASNSISYFFHAPELKPVLKGLSFNFLIGGLGIVPGALLQKSMRFDWISKITIISTITGGFTGIWLALHGWKAMSLVGQSLSSLVVIVLLRFLITKWYPGFIFCWKDLKSFISFSLFLTAYNTIDYWSRRFDDLIVGKFIGANALGIYSRAYYLMLMPIAQLFSIVGGAILPAFSSLQSDKNKVKQSFIQSIRILGFFCFPIISFLIFASDNFILGLLGKKWGNAIPILRILGFAGFPLMLTVSTSWIFVSLGETKQLFKWGIINSVTIILAVLIGFSFGSVKAISWSYVFANFFLVYPVIRILRALIDITFNEIIKNIIISCLISLCMGAIIFMVGNFLPSSLSSIAKLIVQFLVGFATYLSLSKILSNKLFDQVLHLLVSNFKINFIKSILLKNKVS
ncbi:MOP flippase family protein [Thermoflavifilum thermophilum]|uniref:Membrane protein involved in the export of O-antigen and teichoic acid n=1 Tax=Thermoflavifilum thermophilum TaxID=1393122 RepID=A0A1I7NA06_9BACT|nr:MOP flippase family protein [Thermoflavifilum thermophilum]SFV31386.1 Membrane protein involved in the export of O-antigen and teichoic acid [Thermoflavifilum thermophilum]